MRTEPVVIVPAWIMKYYILDLRPEDSLIKSLVDAGFTVFCVSWRNPTSEDRDIDFDDYRREGVMPAIDAALAVTGASHAHLVGYCIGGTLAMIAAACMARDHDERLRTLSLFASQGDFKEAGEVRLFIDDSQLALLEDMMWEQGTLESNQMAGTFGLIRSNDLIWSRAIHKYLMGEPEPVDDLMAWNSDATRMPYKMHSEYLRELFLDNDLAEGRFKLDGRLVALQDIRAPLFVVGTERDHVAPWRSVFKIHYLTDTDITAALVSGGHNRGIVAPPGQGKSRLHFRIATTAASDPRPDPETLVRRRFVPRRILVARLVRLAGRPFNRARRAAAARRSGQGPRPALRRARRICAAMRRQGVGDGLMRLCVRASRADRARTRKVASRMMEHEHGSQG